MGDNECFYRQLDSNESVILVAVGMRANTILLICGKYSNELHFKQWEWNCVTSSFSSHH